MLVFNVRAVTIADEQGERTRAQLEVLLDEEVALMEGIDLSSNTQPDAATSRAWARPLVAAVQQAFADGTLVVKDSV